MCHLLDVGREFCLVKHFSTHWTLGMSTRVEKMVVYVIFQLGLEKQLEEGEYGLLIGKLLPGHLCGKHTRRWRIYTGTWAPPPRDLLSSDSTRSCNPRSLFHTCGRH